MAGGAAFFIDASLFAPGFENHKSIAGKIGYSVIPVDNDEGQPYTALGNGADPKTPVMQMLVVFHSIHDQ